MRPDAERPRTGLGNHAGRGGGSLVEVDRSGLEILDREECLRLLATATLGRVGITNGALPAIVPINFRLSPAEIEYIVGHSGASTSSIDAPEWPTPWPTST